MGAEGGRELLDDSLLWTRKHWGEGRVGGLAPAFLGPGFLSLLLTTV